MKRACALELALTIAALASAGVLAAVHAAAPLAAGLRSGRAIWGALDWEDPASPGKSRAFLLAYHPEERSLDVLEAPALSALDPDGRLGGEDFHWRSGAALSGSGTVADFKAWVAAWPRGAGFWFDACRMLRRYGRPRGLSGYETALLLWEAYRLAPADVRPVWLPPAALRPALLARVLSPPPPAAEPAQIHLEVLNASGEPGVALDATKVLRWSEVDVLDYGNAPALEAQTRLIDRAGRPKDAQRVAALLGCPDAEVWTQFDPRATAPLALVLGRDFRRCRRL